MYQRIANSGLILIIVTGIVACAPSPPATMPEAQPEIPTKIVSPTPAPMATETFTATAVPTDGIPLTGHVMSPANIAPGPGKLVYDVESSGNAAPYGDTYRLNRLERPFLVDMTYVPELDIVAFDLSQDADWYYISINLNGKNPNNSLEINYGVEIDVDTDGFGNYIIWAQPPYSDQWDTANVQVFEDSNSDSGGQSSLQSDALFDGDGYDTLLFDGGASQNADPDLAWVRMNEGSQATIQFAFKKSWIDTSFMVGVVSDAGLKDISKFDYNDHFEEAEAGSPERNESHYPLGSLYAVDNTCWEAYGFEPTGFEPKVCQPIKLPTPTPARVEATLDPCYPLPPCPDDPGLCGCF